MKRSASPAACALMTVWAATAGMAQGGRAAATAATQRQSQVGAFDRVGAAGPHLVVVTVGGAPSVRAEGPTETLDKLEVAVEHGALQIRPKRQYREGLDWRDLQRANFYVSVPRLAGASLAGAGDMRIDRVDGQHFAASVAGSGALDVARLQVADAQFNLSGSGSLSAHGRASRADMSVAGSGQIRARDMTAITASVSIAGSGQAALTAQQTVSVSIVGSGTADIAGPAHCTVSRVGSGQAHCRT